MQLFLEAIGYHVTIAHSVAAALRAAPPRRNSICWSATSDCRTGAETTSFGNCMKRVSNSSGIALSGYGTEQDVARSRAAGFQVHLTKPVSPQDLRTTIDSLLANNVSVPSL